VKRSRAPAVQMIPTGNGTLEPQRRKRDLRHRLRLSNRRLASVVLALSLGACSASNAPSPTPSPSPTPTPPPQGIPSSTAMQNLALVVSLERATGRPGKLVMISAAGLTPDTGRLRPGDGWDYVFADVERNLFRWQVRSGGEVVYEGPGIDRLHLAMTDIQDRLHVDSGEVVEIALRNGGQAFVDRYPAARVIAGCRFQGGLLTWQLEFRDASTLCSPEFWINATDGRLLARDLSCLR